MAFAHKELDVDHMNGIYTKSLYAEDGMGDRGKMYFLGFFFPLLDMTGEGVCQQCLPY